MDSEIILAVHELPIEIAQLLQSTLVEDGIKDNYLTLHGSISGNVSFAMSTFQMYQFYSWAWEQARKEGGVLLGDVE
jgi:hypothetical protein